MKKLLSIVKYHILVFLILSGLLIMNNLKCRLIQVIFLLTKLNWTRLKICSIDTDVFPKYDNDFSFTTTVKHNIRLQDDTPIVQPYRHIPPTHYEEIEKNIKKMHENQIVRESIAYCFGQKKNITLWGSVSISVYVTRKFKKTHSLFCELKNLLILSGELSCFPL